MKKLILIVTICITSCTAKFGHKTELLTGEKIFEDFVKAMGGEKKLRSVKTMTMIQVAQIQ